MVKHAGAASPYSIIRMYLEMRDYSSSWSVGVDDTQTGGHALFLTHVKRMCTSREISAVDKKTEHSELA